MDDVSDLDDVDDIDDLDIVDTNDSIKGSSPSGDTTSANSPSIVSDDSTDDIKISNQKSVNIYWFIGPTVLVTFLVLPSFYLRRMLLMIFEDSLFTGTFFYFCNKMCFMIIWSFNF